jgi:hypothetical protein
MSIPVNILHIDSDYRVHHLVIEEGFFNQSTISLETAIAFLKLMKFDLILSEPHNKVLIEQTKENKI